MTERDERIKTKLTESRAGTLALVETMTDTDWERQAYFEGSEWRMIDVLRHVTDSERGMTSLIAQIQAGGEGVPPDFDLTRWNQRVVSKLQEKNVSDLLEDMDTNRANLLAVIDTLGADDWDKQGRHASLQIMTIEEVCDLIADHEMGHTEAMKLALTG